jgi:hypothetical protein
MGVGGQRHVPATLPPGKIRYPLYRRLGGPPGRSGRVRKISTPPRFDPQTVQPVASRCTDWAIPARPTLGRRKIYDGDELLLDLRNDDVALSGELLSSIKFFF